MGKKEDGISTHIKVKKREEGRGIGVKTDIEVSLEETTEWWQHSFSSGLKAMGKKKSKGKRKAEKEDRNVRSDGYEKEEAVSLEELFVATGGKRMGMRARAEQKGKHRRTEGEGV